VDRSRIAVFLLGPLPIVAASFGITQWWRSGGTTEISGNHVLHADEPRPTSAATGSADDLARRYGNPLTAACDERAAIWRKRLGDECRVIVGAPFVVAGNLSDAQLDQWLKQTIAPAARSLGKSFFDKAPTEPITVLLFSDEPNYNHFAKQLFGDEGISVYGYYKSDQRTLVMNISTGGGTLVHELTHALIDFDFPQVPDWFNEGLASLYEQCRFLPNEAGLEGLPNWRLPGLQTAVREGRLRSLAQLIADDDFRGKDVGLNYAQARYFCLYLQERELLEEFYRRFRAAYDKDPRGQATALGLFPPHDWPEVDRKFQEWVLTLER
jgi:hypothetical protein